MKVVPYPPELASRYRAAGLWGMRPIGDELRATAAAFPDREAVVDPRRRLTYRELDQRTEAIAGGLLAAGLAPGDPVVLQVRNRAQLVEAWYGLLKAGLVPICTLPQHRHHEIDAIATMAGARGHLVEPELLPFAAETGLAVQLSIEALPEAERPLPQLDPDGLAVLQLSGGTTGTPKLIPRLHAEYWYNAVATAARWSYTPADRVAQVLPVVHNAGVHGALHAAHSVGASLLLAPPDPDVFMPFLARERPSALFLVPGLAGVLADRPDFPAAVRHLRLLSLAGAAVPPGLFDRLSELGINVLQHLGMGEGLVTAMPVDAPFEMRKHTVGYPLSELDEVRIVDGELQVRGPYTIRGYYDAAERNAVAFTPDGFYRTGDLAETVRVGDRLCYRHRGRIKDLINRGGEKISAEEVELLLSGHPGIRAVAVVAMPDQRLGERACAFVVPTGSAPVDLDGIRAYLAGRDVAKYKWPERLELVESFPLTPLGKVSKAALREEVARYAHR